MRDNLRQNEPTLPGGSLRLLVALQMVGRIAIPQGKRWTWPLLRSGSVAAEQMFSNGAVATPVGGVRWFCASQHPERYRERPANPPANKQVNLGAIAGTATSRPFLAISPICAPPSLTP